MNNFEKLLMVVVPASGLALIFFFFTLYVPSLENNSFDESQRLQGHSQVRKITKQMPNHKIYNPRVTNKVTAKKGYIKWQSDNTVTHMSKALKNRKYKQTPHQPSNTYPVESFDDQSEFYANQKYQKQIQLRKLKKHQKKIKDQECSYYEQMKEKIRDRMRRKYKASQYNRLEKKRKHWAKLYADNCFSGYQYPR